MLNVTLPGSEAEPTKRGFASATLPWLCTTPVLLTKFQRDASFVLHSPANITDDVQARSVWVQLVLDVPYKGACPPQDSLLLPLLFTAHLHQRLRVHCCCLTSLTLPESSGSCSA